MNHRQLRRQYIVAQTVEILWAIALIMAVVAIIGMLAQPV